MTLDSSTYVAVLLLSLAAGCTPEIHRYVQFPDLAHPGPAYVQRARAIQHDPYPLNDIAPAIDGGRPLAYQISVPEVDRALRTPPRPVVLPAAAPLGGAVVAPPAMSSPYAVAPPQSAAPLSAAPPTFGASPLTSTSTAP